MRLKFQFKKLAPIASLVLVALSLVTTMTAANVYASALIEPETRHFKCDYAFYGAPFVTLEFDQIDDFHASRTVRVTHYGQTHQESFVLVPTKAGEQLHGWVSKESKDNQIEFILYKQGTAQGNSEIINNQMPTLKEIWGQCL